MSLEEARSIFAQRREFYDWVLEMSYQYDMEYTNPVDPETVTKNHQLLDSRFPTVQDATGKIFRPLSSGVWSEVGGSEFFGVNSPEGQELWQIASEQLSSLEQYFVLLLQTHPAFLLQNEYNLLYLFGFTDRRVILSQEQRELRVAMRTPIRWRSARQAQLIERFDLR